MNVFVLCTGRCGSLTFSRACGHVTNFTSGHETRNGVGEARLSYADNHIEVDNRLAWLLGRLDRKFGDDAFYVHLTRDPEKVSRSFASRFGVPGGIISAYRDAIVRSPTAARLNASSDYVATVTSAIELFLRDKSRKMNFRLEDAKTSFPIFWNWIGAQGDLSTALAEFDRRHDTENTRRRRFFRLREFAHRTAMAAFPR